MRFAKYIAAGNDFLIFDNRDNKIENRSALALKACNRHFGLGADGILLVENTSSSDIRMRYFNSDGSEGEMCGNGIRAFTAYLFDNNIIKKDLISIETLAGIKNVALYIVDNSLKKVRVNMGFGDFRPEKIPVDINKEIILNEEIVINKRKFTFSAVLVGVPHVVIFADYIEDIDIDSVGRQIENHSYFPKKTNVNFVEVVNRNKIKNYTWERGAGRTLGCGTGSCSAVLLGNRLKILNKKVEVVTEGGCLEVEISQEEEIFMTGGADLIAVGELFL